MPGNHLEDLVAEWYEFNGFFVRRNVQVGPRARGGYDCELDVVAFHPGTRKLVHIEPSLDAASWEQREERFALKFQAGRDHIPELFAGLDVPEEIEQIALLVFASTARRKTLGGGRILLIGDFMRTIRKGLDGHSVESKSVPEQFPLLRSLLFAKQYWPPEGPSDTGHAVGGKKPSTRRGRAAAARH